MTLRVSIHRPMSAYSSSSKGLLCFRSFHFHSHTKVWEEPESSAGEDITVNNLKSYNNCTPVHIIHNKHC